MTSRRVVQTVLGPIDPDDLGVALAHEHLWMDSRPLTMLIDNPARLLAVPS